MDSCFASHRHLIRYAQEALSVRDLRGSGWIATRGAFLLIKPIQNRVFFMWATRTALYREIPCRV